VEVSATNRSEHTPGRSEHGVSPGEGLAREKPGSLQREGAEEDEAQAGWVHRGSVRMSGYWYAPDDHADEPQTTHGSAHSVSGDGPDRDRAEEVRRVAEEVARRPIPRPARKLGFY
jgi:hypothetical protein